MTTTSGPWHSCYFQKREKSSARFCTYTHTHTQNPKLTEVSKSAMALHYLHLIENKSHAKEMWGASIGVWAEAPGQKLADLRSELFSMSFNVGENLMDYVMKFCEKVSNMKSMGDNLETPDYLRQLFKLLPVEFLPLKVNMRDQMQFLRWEEVTNRLIKFEKDISILEVQ